LPATSSPLLAEFSASALGTLKTYQAEYLQDAQTIAPGGTASVTARLFAGAKEVAILDDYDKALHLNRFDLAIDWGWFRFITKPMFTLIDTVFRLVGNFGVAILIVTLMLKIAFFPLANKSYASAAKMKALQPQIQLIRETFRDDKVKQQQATMELYRKEKINPIAGCLPTLIQIPVFFSLYKVLFVTIEMRQAPFFGWIKDLSAPDPTNVFNLFGLIPYDPVSLPLLGGFLVIGAWPLLMGLTQWLQMKLTPASPDPAQAAVLNWMPVIFTFMLAKFSAGLVIYWTWNNSLSLIQQSIVMRRNGVRIELWDKFRAIFRKKYSRIGKGVSTRDALSQNSLGLRVTNQSRVMAARTRRLLLRTFAKWRLTPSLSDCRGRPEVIRRPSQRRFSSDLAQAAPSPGYAATSANRAAHAARAATEPEATEPAAAATAPATSAANKPATAATTEATAPAATSAAAAPAAASQPPQPPHPRASCTRLPTFSLSKR